MKLVVYKQKTKVDKNSLKEKIFKDILKKDEEIGNQILIYVFLTSDLSASNPILEIPYSHMDEEARLIAFGDRKFDIEKEFGSKWAQLAQEAVFVYKKEYVSDVQKDIRAYDRKLDQFREMLIKTHPTIEKNTNSYGAVSYATNIEIINSVLKDIVSLIQSKASLISMMVQGTIPKHLRGGLSPNTRGKIKTS